MIKIIKIKLLIQKVSIMYIYLLWFFFYIFIHMVLEWQNGQVNV